MDIFEYLRGIIGCAFISDLQFDTYKNHAIKILRQMDMSNIDQRQIADAQTYFGIALA
jgi:hypothetical protein